MLNALAERRGVTFGLHLCRGNNAGHWLSTGGYEAISEGGLRARHALRHFPARIRQPARGLVRAARRRPGRQARGRWGWCRPRATTLETPDTLIARIDEAARYFPREQMALSTQCGFASVLAGNPIAETQEKKLGLVAEVAGRAWG